ncbi:glycoside hydrolase family 28 protein [Maribacter sp. MAR_2009_72]|uniref:glycoside hydrolase family 28 protein n=1 Tax=Maribacter sp. MAR_2009_72 TaxID=1250050 RepID=UPI00119BD4C2|nr:glycosyl hydrolase family 28 protein [Maribacter sp. MAR_2009_72]TVZ14548.1 glycosyl hydrolase family 28 [Maribacter sp. MAR_2009_72]
MKTNPLYIPLVFTLLLLTHCTTMCQTQLQNLKAYQVTDFGASDKGDELSTQAIQQAIDAAHKAKGGKVVLTKGTYLSGTIELKDNVHLQLDEGAILLGTTDAYQYKKLEQGNLALIVAKEASNISITGKGTIDGQGRKLALAIDSLHHIGERIDPKYNKKRMRPNELHRPELINLLRCTNVNFSNVTLKSSASWLQTIEQCTDVRYDSVTIHNRAYWNNDGFDIVDCKNVSITNCNIDAADDGICLKSHSKDHYNDGIYIANCTIRSSASAIKFGTASLGGFKNVTIENIKVFDTFRSAIAIESVDGGIIENVKVNNITALNTGNALFIRLGHRSGDRPGVVKDVSITNIDVQVPFGRPDIDYDLRGPEVNFFHNPFPSSITGIEGYHVENVQLENITIRYPGRASKGMAYVPLSRLNQVKEEVKGYPEFSMFGELPAYGLYVRHVTGITMKNIIFTLENEDFRPAIIFDDVSNITLSRLEVPKSNKSEIILKDASINSIDEELLQQLEKL